MREKKSSTNSLSVSDIYVNTGGFLPLQVTLLFDNLANSVPVTLAKARPHPCLHALYSTSHLLDTTVSLKQDQ